MSETLTRRLVLLGRELAAVTGRRLLLGLDDHSDLVMVQEVRGEQIHTILGPTPPLVVQGWHEGALWALGKDAPAEGEEQA